MLNQAEVVAPLAEHLLLIAVSFFDGHIFDGHIIDGHFFDQ